MGKRGDCVKRPEKEYETYWYAGLTGFCVIVAAVIVYVIINNLSGLGRVIAALNAALLPVYIGIVVAYLLSPLVDKADQFLFIPLCRKIFKEKRRKAEQMARGCSVFVVLVLALFVVFGILMLVIPEIINSITSLASNLPSYYENVKDWGIRFFKSNPELAEHFTNFSKDLFARLSDWLQNDLLPNSNKFLEVITDSVVNVASALLNFFIGIIISIYLMAGKENFCAQGKKITYALLSKGKADHVMSLVSETHGIFAKFISGKIIDSLIVGILTFIIMNIAGIPYTVLISVLIGVTNIIPFFGQYIGIVPSAVLVFIASPSKGVVFLILIIILMQFDGNVLGPKILGDSIGLKSFWILFSILLFGSLFGLLGMICAVPVFAVVYRLIKRWCAGRLAKKRMPTETECYYEKIELEETIAEESKKG